MKFQEAISKGVLKFSGGLKLIGWHSNLRGDCTGLWGDCTGLRGNCTGVKGEIKKP